MVRRRVIRARTPSVRSIVTERLAGQPTSDAGPDLRDARSTIRSGFDMMEAGHPIPDERSLLAGNRVQDFVSGLEPGDLLLCLISGGGSAMVVAPPVGVSLADLQQLTNSLLFSGAGVRRSTSYGGSSIVSRAVAFRGPPRACVVSLILSDVIGDHLDLVTSGPTVHFAA